MRFRRLLTVIQGTTKFLLTRIPYFREIIISSFSCDHCAFQNSEVQSAGEIQPRGSKFVFKVETEADLQRSVVKGDTSVFRIEDIELEIPAAKGRFSNIEGIMSEVKQDLAMHQAERIKQMPTVAQQVAGVIQKIDDMLAGKAFPFTVSVDDPSGNSWIEPAMKDSDGKFRKDEYVRSSTQNAILGIGDDTPDPSATPAAAPTAATGDSATIDKDDNSQPMMRPEYQTKDLVGAGPRPDRQVNNVDEDDIVENQVYTFPATCPGCTKPCDTNMKMVNIPFFKQVVVMSTVCESCGYRSNEVKTGGEVPEKGQRIKLRIENSEDLSRDILKSESASLACPELELRVEPGTLGGRFTTVEGLLTQISTDLKSQVFGLEGDSGKSGDSMQSETKRTWSEFFDKLAEAIEGNIKFTLILEDGLAGSYVQSLTAPERDPQIEVESYTRTAEEEDDLGLTDMKTEGYEQAAADKK